MGIFDFLKKKNKQEESSNPVVTSPMPVVTREVSPKPTQGLLNLSKEESLLETILQLEEPRQSNLVRQLERVVGRMYPRTYRAFYQTLQQQ